MKVFLQRVSRASCMVNNQITGSIDYGLYALVSFTHSDTTSVVEKMVKKVLNLRIFDDENGKMNLNIQQKNGSILSISQFTLYGNTRKGHRPSYVNAMDPIEAELLYDYFNKLIESDSEVKVATGQFGKHMIIDSVNDGPVSIMLEVNND
jgi:D-tyrosyl-tRNA(Tyr) deacylase